MSQIEERLQEAWYSSYSQPSGTLSRDQRRREIREREAAFMVDLKEWIKEKLSGAAPTILPRTDILSTAAQLASRVASLAWEDEHSNGFQAVFNRAEYLLEVLFEEGS